MCAGTDETVWASLRHAYGGAEVFVRLARAAVPGVGRAAARAVVTFLDEPGRVLGLPRERITAERDDRVLIALAESLGDAARRPPGHAAETVGLLIRQSAPP